MIILIPKKNKIEIYISKRRKILYEGHFTLARSFKVLIDEISLQKEYKKINMNDKELIEILKNDKTIITADNKELTDFLNEENILYEFGYVCDNCLQKHIIKQLNKGISYNLYKKHYCRKCVGSHIENIIQKHAYYDFSDRRYEILLDKYHDVTKILDIIEGKYDPLSNPELSLFDVLAQTEQKYDKISIDDLDIPSELKEILTKRIEYLFPVQILALENGLLDDENLLIVSSTASGKTLIGELAGITKALNNKKMIYLSPLVALANQKYRDFKRTYEHLGLNVAIKVGQNRVKADEELHIVNESVEDADIIVATYEGLDFILRSGNYESLNDLGVVVIDEIQMLENEERGHRLNGLVNRLLTLFNEAQLIALSATVKNAEEIAETFDMKLVSYNKRPVQVERHIVPLKNNEKTEFIIRLCKKEFDIISSKNYHGQSIIFTDSRRNTQRLDKILRDAGIKSAYYHAGLTYNRKLEIEEAFGKQEISTIVTTSALSSGVDFPASLVIFESLRMGYDWITPNEFHQMLGRAGRPSYHDTGKVYLLPEINSLSGKEYDIAYYLLKSGVDNISVLYDEDDVYEQVLADICTLGTADLDSLEENYSRLYLPVTFDEALLELSDNNMITLKSCENQATATGYGIAVSKSFISINSAEFIRDNLYEDILNIALNIEQIRNVYLSNKLFNSLKEHGINASSSLFSESNRYLFFSGEILDFTDKNTRNKIINVVNDFFICDCYFSPICSCLVKNISQHIIERRLQGWSPVEISREFNREYDLIIYPGDVYSYLDQIIRTLDAIKRIAEVHNIKSTYEDCLKTIKKIEEGK